MFVSVFELFKVGIGPSSSHTVGPMRAALRFIQRLAEAKLLDQVERLTVRLHGSLAHTGKGHGTDVAIMLGLEGEAPDTVDVDQIQQKIERIERAKQIQVSSGVVLSFNPQKDIVFDRRKILKLHSNGMVFQAYSSSKLVYKRIYFSIGGGFIVNQEGEAEESHLKIDLESSAELEEVTEAVDPIDAGGLGLLTEQERKVPYPFTSADQLLDRCKNSGLSISSLMFENETTLMLADLQAQLDQTGRLDILSPGYARAQVDKELLALWSVMDSCIQRGCRREGILPGGLKVKRRAASLHRRLKAKGNLHNDPIGALDWVNLWALAVNEENAAGGRVVTAPTNGAAGIIPAVLSYYLRFTPSPDEEGISRFLLTAAAIGGLYKMNASISGAEVGCQGEVGVACSMAAGALAEVMGGTPEQVCNAAEVGMEHNLGLTCDPWGGLVQVPCIERNAMGAVKAINAARLALSGDGSHKVSLDKVIETMRRTGADMSSKYKETARGGLALTVIEC